MISTTTGVVLIVSQVRLLRLLLYQRVVMKFVRIAMRRRYSGNIVIGGQASTAAVAIVDIGRARGRNANVVGAAFIATVRPVLRHRARVGVVGRRHVLI